MNFLPFSSPLAGVISVAMVSFAGLAAPALADTETAITEASTPVLDIRPEDAADVCDASVPQIRVTVEGIEPYGILLVEIYGDDKKAFLSSKGRLRRVRVAAETGPQIVCMNLPNGAGTYAVASYHDQDADRKLDKKWNRLPKEPFALSNNPKLKLRKPRLREAAFEADETGADISIRLRGSKADR